MRTGLTIAVHLGGEITELLSGFETSIDVQRANFKKFQAIKTHDVFERVEFWESGFGRVKQHRFTHVQATPEVPIPAPAPAIMAAIESVQEAAPEPKKVEAQPEPEEDEAQPASESNGFDAAPRKRGRPSKS